MRLLINDIIQHESIDYHTNYSSPQLYQTITFDSPIIFRFDKPYIVDCIGLGNCDAYSFTIINSEGYSYTYIFDTDDILKRNGLYLIPEFIIPYNELSARYEFTILFNSGATIGRIAAGKSRQIKTAEAKELGFYTNKKELRTVSGAVLPTIAGYAARQICLTSPYQITPEIYNDFRDAYITQGCQSFPMFIAFDKSEAVKFNPIGLYRFYGNINNNFMFQTSVHKFLYSYAFTFTEAF